MCMNKFNADHLGTPGKEVVGHLLQLHGVLKTFSVSRLLTKDDLKKLRTDADGKPSRSKKVFTENLKKYLEQNKNELVPGTIYKKPIFTVDDSVKEKVRELFSKHKANPIRAIKPGPSDLDDRRLAKIAEFIANELYKENLEQGQISDILLSVADILGMDMDAFIESLGEELDDDDLDDEDDEGDPDL